MKLSVCIPVYNVAPYVEQCARSLFGQTYEDMEFLFVDDATPDDSIGIVRRVLADYPARQGQVKFLRHETNRGLVAARKTAIRAATGDLITHCDSDDWVDPDLYAKMVGAMKAADADAVLSSVVRVTPDGNKARAAPDGLCLSGMQAVLRADEISNLASLCTKVVRREVLDGFEPEWPDGLCIGEDLCCSMQLLPRCRLLVSAPDAHYYYRSNPAQMTASGNLARLIADQARVYDILTRRLPEDASRPICRHLARTILFWGVVGGLLGRRGFGLWRERLLALGGRYDFSDKTLWGQRMMKLAERSIMLSELVAPLVRRRVNDLL